jgi:chromosome segregation ATPase
MDAAYKAADTTLGNRITEVEGKLANVSNVMDFIGARTVAVSDEGVITVTAVDNETFNKGDVVVDNGGKEFVYDGEAWHEFGYADGNTAAIEDLQGRMTTAEGEIDQAQADISALQTAVGTKLATADFNTWKGTHETDHAKTATEITAEITAAVNGEKSAREAADLEINNKIGDATTAAAGTVYGAIADAKQVGTDAAADAAAVAGRMDVAEPKITTLQDIVNGYTAKDSIKTAVEAAQNAADDAQDAADAAQEAADKAQSEVDTLEGVVAGVKATAEDAQTRVAAVEGRMTTAEGEIDSIQDVLNGYTIKSSVKTAIEAAQTQADKGVADAATAQAAADKAQGEVDALESVVAGVKSTAEDAQTRVAAIEADYVKVANNSLCFGDSMIIFNCGSATEVI